MANHTDHPAFDELGDPSSRAILALLAAGPRSVTEIVEATGLKQPNVSNHLARMRRKQLVVASRTGRRAIYALADPAVAAILASAPPRLSAHTARSTPSSEVQRLAAEFGNALVDGDEPHAARVVRACLAARIPLATIYVDVFQPALYRIGARYAAGLVSEAEEHAATAITERLMSRIAPLYQRFERNAPLAVVAAVEGNVHGIGVRMVADVLQTGGWHVVYLGPNMPTTGLAETVGRRKPELVCLGATLGADCEQVAGAVEACRRAHPSCRIAVGGLTAGRESMRWQVDILASDVRDLLAQVRRVFP